MSNYKRYSDSALTSVGIDIGTTSCHLVFSRLSLANEASTTQIPRLVISERKVVWESPIFLTPLNPDGSIDGAQVSELLRLEYSKSGFKPDDIDCGAVIITGETAGLRNAEQVVEDISSLAGDFVAASAGPELESILAGRGSGALQYSREHGKTICNVDIGGGTTNIATFHNGELVETSCLRIGGRILQFSDTGELLKTSGSGLALATATADPFLNPGNAGLSPASIPVLKQFGRCVAEVISNYITTGTIPSDLETLIICSQPTSVYRIDEYWLSGGVAALMQNPGNKPFVYKDFGWFLAKGLLEVFAQKSIKYHIPNQPIRATVLGAGSYSVQLSGNTVSVSTDRLPLKGVPLIRPFEDQEDANEDTITACLNRAISVFDHTASKKPIAIILNFKHNPRYALLKSWAEALAGALRSTSIVSPYILIVSNDSAMALGQLLKGAVRHNDIVVLDGIDLSTGDYIDIGKPLRCGNTIPVTVKSLIFWHE